MEGAHGSEPHAEVELDAGVGEVGVVVGHGGHGGGDRVLLNDPKWSGLVFTGWTDADGKKYTEIPAGTTEGDSVHLQNPLFSI